MEEHNGLLGTMPIIQKTVKISLCLALAISFSFFPSSLLLFLLLKFSKANL